MAPEYRKRRCLPSIEERRDPVPQRSSLGAATMSADGFLSTLGTVTLCYLVGRALLPLIRELYLCVLAPALGLGIDWSKVHGWAVVTGSTDGIGKEYAKQLARKGINIVLVSRTQSKLDATADEISSKYNVKTKTIAVDFSGGMEIFETIRKELEDIPVSILVNNVGMSYEKFEYFSNLENRKKLCENLVKINVIAALMMMDLILPQMEKRRSGVIINISSMSALVPTPLLSVYSATKAFVDYLSLTLGVEYKSRGIIIQSVLPSFVNTKMIDMIVSRTYSNSPQSFVFWALKTVGIESRTFGHPFHRLQALGVTIPYANLPTSLFLNLHYQTIKFFKRTVKV